MKLYIANPTRQRQVICYRLDFDDHGQPEGLRRFQPARQQDVDAGRQAQIGGDMHMTQIEDIVAQLARYGMVGVVDVPRLKAADFTNLRAGVVPYVFNVDRPVPADVIRRVMAHNDATLIASGQQRRMKAAVATNDIVQHTVAQQFAERGIDEPVADRTTVTFEQEERSEAGEDMIAEGYKVSADAPPTKPSNRGARGRFAGKNRAAA